MTGLLLRSRDARTSGPDERGRNERSGRCRRRHGVRSPRVIGRDGHSRRGPRWLLAFFRSAVLGLLTSLVLASSAGAFLYYGDTNNYAIGRAGLAGQGPLDPFIGDPALPCGVAVDGPYIYWGQKVYGQIGRARIDGSGKPDASFIVGASEPCGLAAYGQHLYWVNDTTDGSIGRANLTGPLDVHENFVPSEQGSGRNDLNEPCGVAVDHTGIYWTDFIGGAVGHANLDGTGETTLIPGAAAQACGVAAGGGYVYFAHNPYLGADSIGRALESGTNVDNTYITGLSAPCGATLYSHYLYFSDGATIDRTDLTTADPTAATEQIVLGTKSACGVAIDTLYAGTLAILTRHPGHHETARLTIKLSDPGVVVVQQTPGPVSLPRTLSIRIHRAGPATITLHPTAAATNRLTVRPHLKVHVRITYTPTGGIATTKTTNVVLARG
jgi:hypothetical protein